MLKSGQIEGHRIGIRGVRIYVDSIAAMQAGSTICPPAAPPKARSRAQRSPDLDEAIEYLKARGLM